VVRVISVIRIEDSFVFSEDEFMDQVKTLANNLGFDAFCIPTIVTSTESSFNEREEY